MSGSRQGSVDRQRAAEAMIGRRADAGEVLRWLGMVRSYKDYYVTKSEELNGAGTKIAEAGKNGKRRR